MGTTLNKLEYLDETKGQIKTALNQFNVGITDETTFRNYVDKINNIYDNWEKVTGEGTAITLNNTKKGKLYFEDNKVCLGDTTQESTNGYQLIPYTLATLKAINTAGTWNNNVYTYSGITYTIEEENGYIKEIKTTGTATATSFMYLINSLTISAGTYYVSGCPNGGSVSTYFIYAGSGLNHNTSDTPTATILNEDVSLTSNNLRITVINGTNANNLIWKPMLSKTNTTDYEPYTNGPAPNPSYPFPIKTVTGTQEVTIRGKNEVVSSQKGYWNNDGVWQDDTTFCSSNKMEVQESKTYVGSMFDKNKNYINKMVYVVFDSNENFVRYTGDDTVTIANGEKYVSIRSYSAQGTYVTSNNFLLQFEENTTHTSYEPYITPITKQLSLGNIELAEIGTYRDYIWTDRETKKWYKHSAIGKVVLNGTETWYKSGNTSNNGYLGSVDSVISNALKPANNGINANVLSNYFISYSVNSLLSNGLIGIGMRSDGIICIGTSLSGISVLTDFTNWLSTHNTDVYYALEIPTDTEITDTTLISQLEEIYNIMSLNGTTKIEINGNLPMILKVGALKGGVVNE